MMYHQQAWLPPQSVSTVEEANRFHACVQALHDHVVSVQAIPSANREPNNWQGVLQWIPILNNLLDVQEDVYRLEDVITCIHVLKDIVLNTSDDIEVQARAAQALTSILDDHKLRLSRRFRDEDGMLPAEEPQNSDVLHLRLDWRPWLDLLLSLMDDPPPDVEGFALKAVRQQSLLRVVALARRYFAPDAAFDIWHLLGPSIESVGCDQAIAYDALGWVSLFTPTFCISSCKPAALNQLVGKWMEGWKRMPNSPPWNAMWLSLLSRAAKHDYKGAIDWTPHLDILFTNFIGAFDVPVGAATSMQATVRSAPAKAVMHHNQSMSGLHTNGASMVASLLRARPGDEQARQCIHQTLKRLRHMAALIDNYFHPSNSGKWCRDLSAWTRNLVEAFMRQIGKQGATPPPWFASIEPTTMTAFVACMTPLAARGQFSKDDSLSSTCVKALSSLAYIAPSAVLPLVISRFRTAVESQTATHQLAATITCFSMCIRPILLSGWGMDSDGESGVQLLAEALMALLPGIDANDEQKTMAVMQLYTTALSSLPVLAQTGDEEAAATGAVCLPLYLEEWGEEVLGRVLALLSGLDSGLGHRADAAAGRGGSVSSHAAGGVGGGGSFLTAPGSFFPHLASLLFSRLPSDSGAALAKRAARFAASELLPGVEQAVGVLLHAAVEHHPEVTWKEGVLPLMLRVITELRPHAAGTPPGHAPPSPSLEATLCYQLGLLRQGVFAGAVQAMLPHAQQLLEVVDVAVAVPSHPIQNAGSALLSSICCVCVRYYTQPDLLGVPGQDGVDRMRARLSLLGPHGIEQWVDKHATDCPRPKWLLPPPEALSLAQQLIDSHLLAPLPRLLELLDVSSPGQDQQRTGGANGGGDGGHKQRMQLHGELVKMKGVIGGLLSTLRDFDFLGHAGVAGTPISAMGNTGVIVGQPGTRERIAEALSTAAPAVLGMSDSECIGEFLVIGGLLASAGSLEHAGCIAMASDTSKLMSKVEQPAAANLLLLQRGGAAAEATKSRPWRKQVPRWAAISMLDQTLAKRGALSSYRSFSTAAMPELISATMLPPSYRTLVAELCKFTTHSLSTVRMEALPIVDSITKRFPRSIARTCLPHFLCALADVPPPPELAPHGQDAGSARAEEAFMEGLAKAAAAGEGGLGAAAADGTAAEGSQVEKDGRVLGACAALSACMAFWRLIFRDPMLFASALHAIMASRTHTSTQAQAALSNLMIGFSSRFIKPLVLTVQSLAYAKLAQQMLHLAHLDTLRASWRYSLSANVVCLMLMPAPSHTEHVMPFARHVLGLFGSGMLQLRQLAAGTLSLLLTRLVDYKEANPRLVAEVSAWLTSSGSSLADHLAADHTKLEAVEASQDKRGGGLAAMQARYLNMTHDELILKVVAASMDRMQRWPEGGHSDLQPQGVRTGLFEVRHARLVALLATVAPQETLQALQPSLEQAARNASSQQVVAYTSEKMVQAAAAEATAGLLAAGAPWVSGAGTGSGADHEHWVVRATAVQLQTMSLELSESWSLAIRFGVHGLVAMVRPAPTLSHITHAPAPVPSPKPTLPPHLAEMALGTVLGLAQSMGPPLVTPIEPPAGATAGDTTAAMMATGAPAAATGTAGADKKGGASGVVLHSGPGQLKRLRTLHQCARELSFLDVKDAAGLPQAVQSFWASLLVELCASLHQDVFNLRQQLAKTLALTISYLGGPAGSQSLTGAAGQVPAGTGLQAAQALAAARAGQAMAAAASAAAAGSGLQAVQALRGDAPPGVGAAGVEALRGAARALAADFLAALASATTIVRLLKFSPNTGKTGIPATSPPNGGLPLGGGHASSSESARASSDAMMVDAASSPNATSSSEHGSLVSDATTAVALSQVGLAAGVVSWGVLFGDLSSMRPLLLRSLPHFLRLQELAGPITQNVAQETALALAILKYIPAGSAEGATMVTDALQGAASPASSSSATAAATTTSEASSAAAAAASTATALAASAAGMQEVEAAAVAATQSAAAAAQAAAAAGGELWSARAAALAYAQSFWFRTCFLLSRMSVKSLEDVVVSRLADAKPEVRVVAGATLSGMVRGMPEAEAEALRAKLVTDAHTLLRPPGKGRGAASVSPAEAAEAAEAAGAVQAAQQLLLQKHGLVQGLKAYLLSSPYDCPPWMPRVLMALVRCASAASQEASLRSAAAKALSEFKRTHEADSMEALKAMMDSDEWESMQQVTSPASYFT